MKVLYVNHTAEVSGGEHSLLNLLSGLPEEVEPLLACPPGRLAQEARSLGVQTTPIPGTDGSLRLHPVHSPRAVAELAAGAVRLRRLVHRQGPALVHANSIRAGLSLGAARAGIPTLVHVRDTLPPATASRAALRALAASTTSMIANSRYTAEAVRRLAPRARLDVVHNPVDLRRWDPARLDREGSRARLPGVEAGALVLAVVAQLTPWKGQDVAVEALGNLIGEGIDAHLLLIGSAKFVSSSTRFDNRAYLAELEKQVAERGLQERVHFLGERSDVPELVSAADVLLLPSWEEPFGRALIEAMALGVPVVATEVGGPPEIVSDGREGFLVAPRRPEEWAQALRRFVEDPALGPKMGRAGRLRAERDFSLPRHVGDMLELYRRTLAAREAAQ